nr:MAG TPA: hypothetical protein [Caudoviricetes sp.]
MSKFIEVHDTIINVDDIRKVEFLDDDIYLRLLPKGQHREYVCDFIVFDFAKIHTFDGNVILLSIDLYIPQDEESEDDWINRNRAYISMTMEQLHDILKPIKITEKEYY